MLAPGLEAFAASGFVCLFLFLKPGFWESKLRLPGLPGKCVYLLTLLSSPDLFTVIGFYLTSITRVMFFASFVVRAE